MAKKYKLITYRILQQDEEHYNEIKDFIINELHTDMCFVQWSLLRAFFKGLSKSPSPQDVTEIKFLRQNIQLNIGCTINYNRLKARRLPPREPKLELDKNHFFPLLLEEWETMTLKNQEFWRARLIEKGIIEQSPPSISTRAREIAKTFKNFFHSIVHQLLAKVRGFGKG